MPKTAAGAQVSPLLTSSLSPLVNSIVQTLTDRIQAGQYSGREGFPAERELVEEFKVSRNLIRRALARLEEENRIIRAPRCRTIVRPTEEGSEAKASEKGVEHKPPKRATPKVARRTLSFSIWPGENDPATAAVLRGIHSILDHSAYRLLMGHVTLNAWGKEREAEQLFLDQMVQEPDIAGILLWHLNGEARWEALQKVRDAGVPMVFLDCAPPTGFEADFVGVNNEQSAMRAVRHLAAMGHRQIAHVSNRDTASTVKERLQGYKAGLEASGLPFRPEFVVRTSESCAAEAPVVYAALLEELMTLPDPPTAVFTVNDITAFRFMKAVVRSGRRVPEDIAVVGFDGLERWMDRAAFLTTAAQPFEQMGQTGVRALLRQIDSGGRKDAPTYHQYVLDAPLQVYGSTDFFRR